MWIVWQSTSVAGILLSSLVPLEWGLGFAGTLSMLGIAYSLLNDRTAWVAAIVSAAAAVAAFSLPLKLNILVAIAAAVAATLVMAQAGKAARSPARRGLTMDTRPARLGRHGAHHPRPRRRDR